MGRDYIEEFFDDASHTIGSTVSSALDYVLNRPKKEPRQKRVGIKTLRKQLREAKRDAMIQAENERLQRQIDALKTPEADKPKNTGVRTV